MVKNTEISGLEICEYILASKAYSNDYKGTTAAINDCILMHSKCRKDKPLPEFAEAIDLLVRLREKIESPKERRSIYHYLLVVIGFLSIVFEKKDKNIQLYKEIRGN